MTPTEIDRRLAEIAAHLNRRAQPGPAGLSETVTYYSVQCTLLRDHVAFLLGLVEQQGREILRLRALSCLEPHTAIGEVIHERARQEAKWGRQDHPWHPPGLSASSARAELQIPSSTEAKDYVAALADYGLLSWSAILLEEMAEAVDEDDETIARRELIQVAAVAVAAVEAIDRRIPPARLADDERHLADILRRPSPPPSPVPPASAGSAPASHSCTPTGSEGGHGRVRTCPDCTGRTTHAGACLTCAGTGFVGVP